jgi:hypothetical protein
MVRGTPYYRECPTTTLVSHAPRFSLGPCRRSRRVCLPSWSFLRSRWAMGQRRTVHLPRLVVPHMGGKPRQSKGSGCPWPRLWRRSLAQRPHSRRRVWSGGSSRWHLWPRSRRSRTNCSASSWCGKPTRQSSPYRTLMTSPRACLRRHGAAQRAQTSCRERCARRGRARPPWGVPASCGR